MTALAGLWEGATHRTPNKLAVVARDGALTYAALADQIRCFANALHHHWRLRSGEVVAILTPNYPEFVVGYLAAVRLGLTVQPLDERLTAEEIEALLDHSGAGHLIVDGDLWLRLASGRALSSPPRQLLVIGADVPNAARCEDWIQTDPAPLPEAEASPETVAELMYTSGSTGEPKGVMRSHGNVLAAVRNAICGFGYRDDDVIVIPMPLSHSSALNSQLLPMLQLGGTVVLLERFDSLAMIAAIRRRGGTCFRAVPAMLRMLLASPNFSARALPSLRLIVNSSAPLDACTYAELQRRFPEVEVANSYGLTEASTCTILSGAAGVERPDSIGVAIPGVEISVRDDEGHCVPDEHEGEICIAGPHVFKGYRGRPEASRDALRDGLLWTGDLGRRDAEGFLYLHGRRSEVINCGGHKVIPFEVEQCIRQLSGVADVAVVGWPHRTAGEVAKAFVVTASGVTLEKKHVTQHCARRLSGYKVPFHVEFLRELPRNAAGKILLPRLRCDRT